MKISLETEEGLIYEIKLSTAMKLGTIKNVLEFLENDANMEDNVIPVMKVRGVTLRIIVQWLEMRREKGNFVQCQEMLKHLIDSTYISICRTGIKAEMFKSLLDVAIASDYLDVPELLQVTIDMLDLHTENCFILLELAHARNQNILNIKSIEEYIDKHFLEATKCEGFVEITQETLESVISRDSLNVPREEDVIKAVFKWIEKHDDEDKSCLLKELLKHLRGQFIKLDYLKTSVIPFLEKVSVEYSMIVKSDQRDQRGLQSDDHTFPQLCRGEF